MERGYGSQVILNFIAVIIAVGGVWLAQGTPYEWLIDVVAKGSISGGLFFFFGTTIGLLRFPDFYSRLHAAGKGDTLSTAMILYGCAIFVLHHQHLSPLSIIVAVKLLIIVNCLFIGSPTATHAIMDAGYETEVKHWTKRKDGK